MIKYCKAISVHQWRSVHQGYMHLNMASIVDSQPGIIFPFQLTGWRGENNPFQSN